MNSTEQWTIDHYDVTGGKVSNIYMLLHYSKAYGFMYFSPFSAPSPPPPLNDVMVMVCCLLQSLEGRETLASFPAWERG